MSFLSLFRRRPYYHRDIHRDCRCRCHCLPSCGCHPCCCCHLFCSRILWGIFTFLMIFGVVVFLVFIILRPSKPEFVLKGIAIYSLNISSSPISTISISMQIDLMSLNHNGRIGIHYQEAEVFASYRGEQITGTTSLTSIYQGHHDMIAWSPFLFGNAVSLSPESATALIEEINFGELLFAIKVGGKVKWKVGAWTSGSYLLSASCPTSIRSGNLNFTSNDPGVASVFHLSQNCNVEVDL